VRGGALVGRCDACHRERGARAVQGGRLTRAQWERYFRNGTHDHSQPLGDRFAVPELAAIKAFLMTQALDATTSDQGAGVP
jgi:hypothetical protein